MLTSIHQPSYFAWQGLLNKIKESERFILLDDVQLQDRGFQHRNLFLDKSFGQKLLTIPVEKKFYRTKEFRELKTAHNLWQKKHLSFFRHNYNQHPFYDEIMQDIAPLYEKSYTFLIDFLEANMRLTLQLFSIDTPIILQSELSYDKTAKKSALILELLEEIGASRYLSGRGARHYQNQEEFAKRGIRLLYQNYKQEPYPQYRAKKFHSGLASLDLLFNVGKEKAPRYI